MEPEPRMLWPCFSSRWFGSSTSCCSTSVSPTWCSAPMVTMNLTCGLRTATVPAVVAESLSPRPFALVRTRRGAPRRNDGAWVIAIHAGPAGCYRWGGGSRSVESSCCRVIGGESPRPGPRSIELDLPGVRCAWTIRRRCCRPDGASARASRPARPTFCPEPYADPPTSTRCAAFFSERQVNCRCLSFVAMVSRSVASG